MEHVLLITATLLCGLMALLCFVRGKPAKAARVVWMLIAGLVLFAFCRMCIYLIQNNYAYSYVYDHVDNHLPVLYRISALWSGQEGSFLLWGLLMVLTGFFIRKESNRVFGAYCVLCSCILLLCCIASPFSKQAFVPSDGVGLNKALQNPWMVVHPPLVFMAYSAMAVLACKAAGPKHDRRLITGTGAWIKASWILLGMGIFTGSIWAYKALGWGGYWAWDPIENAALVPWLVLSGFLHEQRAPSRNRCVWPLIAAIAGTFLTRSGLLSGQSPHAYVTGNAVITSILICVIAVLVLLLTITAFKETMACSATWQKPPWTKGGPYPPYSTSTPC